MNFGEKNFNPEENPEQNPEQNKNSGELNPTKKEVNDFFQKIAKEFGEEIKFYDADNYTEEEIINNMKNQNWEFIGKFTSWNKETPPGKTIKMIGLGNEFLVFEKDEEIKNQ
ncbi:MAG: hypothetical protein ACP5QN_02100 [Minisyncoccia bacterium]